uniref:Uncharacterized protein n=1 Tax=Arundo donax TaxID=35708 RepID=A0A0A8YT19_ARUDO
MAPSGTQGAPTLLVLERKVVCQVHLSSLTTWQSTQFNHVTEPIICIPFSFIF